MKTPSPKKRKFRRMRTEAIPRVMVKGNSQVTVINNRTATLDCSTEWPGPRKMKFID